MFLPEEGEKEEGEAPGRIEREFFPTLQLVRKEEFPKELWLHQEDQGEGG